MFGKLKKFFGGGTAKPTTEALYTPLAESKHASFWKNVVSIFKGKNKVDEDVLEQMEEFLLSADVGFETTTKILDRFTRAYQERKPSAQEEGIAFFKALLAECAVDILTIEDREMHPSATEDTPYVVVLIGVNGAGKTTTIAKLAHRFKQEGARIVLGAGDTFRAGATEQLEQWAGRLSLPIVKHQHHSPSAVAFDTIKYAQEHRMDIALVDTSGRLHNNVNLMGELKKIITTIQKQMPQAPHETILIIDGTSGQNAIEQAKKFSEVAPVSGIIVTKLDGTSKGGILLSISDRLNIPIRYVGMGEKLDDLVPFDPKSYIEKMLQSV